MSLKALIAHPSGRAQAAATIDAEAQAMAPTAFASATQQLPLTDPRTFQVLSLVTLLTTGMTVLGFDQKPMAIPLIVATSLGTQWAFTKALRLPVFDPVSPLITSLSLSILLRANDPAWLMLAAFLAMASKFVVRVDGQHVFNPANFGICVLLLSGQGWISPAQWGSTTTIAFLVACLASQVLSRARRADISLAFLGTYVAILLIRAGYLGDPWPIPLKQMQSGAPLLFAFFMISDPKTSPKLASHRIAFGVLVACIAGWLQFARYMPECLMYALFFTTPLVPLLNRIASARPKPLYTWSHPTV